MPTPEIDLVAFKMGENELLLIEAKSFLDSPGVFYEAIAGAEDKGAKRYKLFTNDTYREKVTNQLKKQFLVQGLIDSKTRVNYALAAGHFHSGDEQSIIEHFSNRKWKVFTPVHIKEYLKQLASKGWEDDLVTMTVKLLKKK